MKIQIKGKIYLEADDKQFLIKEYSGKQDAKGNDIYKVLGYYGKLNHAIKSIIQMKITDSKATTLQELAADLKKIEAEVDAMIQI